MPLHIQFNKDLLKWVSNEWQDRKQNELLFQNWNSWGPSREEHLTRSFSEAEGEVGGQGLRVGLGFPDASIPQPPNHVQLESGTSESARLIPGLTVWCFLPPRNSPYTLPRAFQSLPLGSSSQKIRRQLLNLSTTVLTPLSTSLLQWHSPWIKPPLQFFSSSNYSCSLFSLQCREFPPWIYSPEEALCSVQMSLSNIL